MGGEVKPDILAQNLTIDSGAAQKHMFSPHRGPLSYLGNITVK